MLKIKKAAPQRRRGGQVVRCGQPGWVRQGTAAPQLALAKLALGTAALRGHGAWGRRGSPPSVPIAMSPLIPHWVGSQDPRLPHHGQQAGGS